MDATQLFGLGILFSSVLSLIVVQRMFRMFPIERKSNSGEYDEDSESGEETDENSESGEETGETGETGENSESGEETSEN